MVEWGVGAVDEEVSDKQQWMIRFFFCKSQNKLYERVIVNFYVKSN